LREDPQAARADLARALALDPTRDDLRALLSLGDIEEWLRSRRKR
jgi:hypothetical protein